jgi:hypothetical protein
MASKIIEIERESKETVRARNERYSSILKAKNNLRENGSKSVNWTVKWNANHGPSEKWLETLYGRYGIDYRTYVIFEFLFRQLMIYPKNETGFAYESEQSHFDNLLGLPPNRKIDLIESLVAKNDFKDTYGLNNLSFDKKEVIRRVGVGLKGEIKRIDELKLLAREMSLKNRSEVTLIDFQSEIEALRAKALKKAEKKISINSRPLRGFVKITSDGEIKIDPIKFDFFRFYSVFYHSLLSPFFERKKEDAEDKDEVGVYSLIANKLNFEFGSRLAGVKFSSNIIRDRVRDSKGLSALAEVAFKKQLVDDAFYDHIYSQAQDADFLLPFQYIEEHLK